MKKLVLLAVCALGAWQYLQESTDIDVPTFEEMITLPSIQDLTYKETPKYRCDGRQYCSDMQSLEEAIFFINNCPDTKMDGDNDGKPCENDSRF